MHSRAAGPPPPGPTSTSGELELGRASAGCCRCQSRWRACPAGWYLPASGLRCQLPVARPASCQSPASGLNLTRTLPVGPLRMPLRLPGTGASTRATGKSPSSRGPPRPAHRGDWPASASGCGALAHRAARGQPRASGRRGWQPERRARVRSACGALQLKFGSVACAQCGHTCQFHGVVPVARARALAGPQAQLLTREHAGT